MQAKQERPDPDRRGSALTCIPPDIHCNHSLLGFDLVRSVADLYNNAQAQQWVFDMHLSAIVVEHPKKVFGRQCTPK